MTLRTTSLERLNGGSFDVMIVGGGINGAVAAAVLAGRGASVAIIARGDFGGFTSQESSNLVWGGFKYLENYEIPLVRGLCKSRNRLIKAYPDNVKSIGFLAALDETSPYSPRLAALGANAYWALGSFQTPRPLALTPTQIGEAEPVIDTIGLAGPIHGSGEGYVDVRPSSNSIRLRPFTLFSAWIAATLQGPMVVVPLATISLGSKWFVATSKRSGANRS